MADPTKEAPLTGESSIFPYGLDTFHFERNYQSTLIEEQGDVITASLRNHIADATLALEAELLGVSNSYSGDMLVSCVTSKVTSWDKLRPFYSIPLPGDVKSFIIGDNPAETLQSTRLPVVLLVGLRPLTQLTMWDGETSASAIHHTYAIEGNTIHVTLYDPMNTLSTSAEKQASGHLGDYIISVILFRQR